MPEWLHGKRRRNDLLWEYAQVDGWHVVYLGPLGAVRRIPEWILLRRHVPVQVDLLREFRFRYGLQQRRRRRPLCWDGLLLVHGERCDGVLQHQGHVLHQ